MALALAAFGCGAGQERASFTPLEHAEGQTIEGYKEALYDLSDERGKFGEVRVWTKGAYSTPLEGTQQTVIHVGMDLENAGGVPITLDPEQIRLESVQTKNQTLEDVPVSAQYGSTTVAPNSTARAELVFTMPPGVGADDIQAFRVAWTARANGYQFSEFTPFAKSEPTVYYVPINAYYHPYYSYHYPFYDPWYRPWSRVVIVRDERYPRRMVVEGTRQQR